MLRFIAVLAATVSFCSSAAFAQAYPNKAVRLIVPFAAGAGTDVVARTVMQRAGEILGQPMVVENRVGAGGNIGAEAGAKAAPDGYTITILSIIHAANQSFYRKLGYSTEGDFVPVVDIDVSPTLWVVRADLPVRTAQELAQLATSSPGKLTYGSGGASHAAELFKALTGGDITVVPYKGVSAVMQDLPAGRVDMSVAGFLDSDAHIRSGKPARAGHHQHRAFVATAGRAGDARIPARLRLHAVVRHIRAARHAGRHRYTHPTDRRGRLARPCARGAEGRRIGQAQDPVGQHGVETDLLGDLVRRCAAAHAAQQVADAQRAGVGPGCAPLLAPAPE